MAEHNQEHLHEHKEHDSHEHDGHEHGEHCGCGHEHHHEHDGHEHGEHCGCGHEHHHEHDGHEHGEHCGCGHEHHHEHDGHEHGEHCGCGHEHHHEHDGHEHGEHCGCGHEHHHEHDRHEHGEHCGCGHEHHHEHNNHEHGPVSSKAPCTVYVLKNIDCANCSAKIEAKIRELPEVEDAVLTFATRQLRVYSSAGTALLPKMQEIAERIEPGTLIEVRESRKKAETDEKKQDGHSHDTLDIISGTFLFLAGEFLSARMPSVSIACFVAAYIMLGREILLTALKNMKSGHVMDENFLMSIATLGAFFIRQYDEAVGVMLFYRIGEAFEHRAVEKSRSQIMEAVDLRPETVLLEENGTVREIPAEEAMAGQIIQVRPGDRIPLDGVILEGESRIDTSPITGEPVPVSVSAGSSVLSGCVNTSGLLKLRVEKELSESMVTRILDSVENAAASKPQVERFITKFARIYTPIVVALAAATAILPSLITGDWGHWVYTALTFLVISCPCALVLSVPLAFFSGIGAGSRKGILFKGGVALEALKGVKTVVMDKTGTITKGNFVVQNICPEPGITKDELLQLAASCETASTHPIGNSILTAARENGFAIETPNKIEELSGKGIRAFTKDRTLLCGNKKLMEENHVNISSYKEEAASTMVLLARDNMYIGSISIADTMKPEAASAIASLKKLGIHTAMLTGDSEAAANAVARETGIDTVYSKLLPGEKLDILKKLRSESGSAMFVGDGINDAPVLAGADVGAAMGSGADAAIEAADVVFMTSSMEAIPASIRIARETGAIASQNMVFALAIKVLVMILGLLGFASMWMAVFADSGVAMLCVLNAIRILYKKQ